MDRSGESEQTTFFFEVDGRRLLGVYYPAAGGVQAERAAVLCNGFAGEHVICRPHLTNFARWLAARGVPCLRFDYTGYGDSEGQFQEATPERMAQDARGALAELGRRSGARRFLLVGVRLGATVAALTAAGRDDLDALVLWEPLPELWKYIFAELRQTVAMQTLLFRDVRVNRETMVENTLAGRPSLVDGYDMNVIDDGYPLSKAFIEGVKAVDLLATPPQVKARTLILHLRERPGAAPRPLNALADGLREAGAPEVEVDTVVQQTVMWKHGRYYMTHSPEVYERTLAWLFGEKPTTNEAADSVPAASAKVASAKVEG